jgi:hypothetical protein
MKCSVGRIDRVIRLSVGLVLVVLAASSVIGAWGWIGIVPLASGVFKLCPMYSILGINTCGTSRSNDGFSK